MLEKWQLWLMKYEVPKYEGDRMQISKECRFPYRVLFFFFPCSTMEKWCEMIRLTLERCTGEELSEGRPWRSPCGRFPNKPGTGVDFCLNTCQSEASGANYDLTLGF